MNRRGAAPMLKGQSAVVTGSTSGIGLGIAEALARAGANVMLNGSRPPEQAEPLRAKLEAEADTRIAYSSADMAQPEQIRRMMAEAEERFGAVDILVNNAGVQFVAPVDEFPDDRWAQILAINLSSCFHTDRKS